MADTEQRIAEVRARLAAATPGPWIPGRPDMQSFDASTGEAFTNVYADNPHGRVHFGKPLPYTIARVLDESGRNKADAELIGFAPSDIEYLLQQLSTVPEQIAAARAEEREACIIAIAVESGPAVSRPAIKRAIAAIRARGEAV